MQMIRIILAFEPTKQKKKEKKRKRKISNNKNYLD